MNTVSEVLNFLKHQAGLETAMNHPSGIKITTGTIVDATIIGAPSSTKNKDGKRDPEMHQTGKGKQWLFRHEGAHRSGQPVEARAHGSGLGSQCG